MRIAFDIIPLLNNSKTGVGYNEHGIVSKIISNHKENQYYLEYFEFRNSEEKRRSAARYLNDNVQLSTCKYIPGFFYKIISSVLPVPYGWFIKNDAQVTHFFNYIIPPFVKGKRVVTIHDMTYKRFPETMRTKTKYSLKLALKKSIKRADIIVTVSEFSKSEILHFYNYPENKIRVIPNGVDRDVFNPDIDSLKIDEAKKCYGISEKYILFFGTVEPRKNLKRLIQAYKDALHECDLPQLVIAGGNGWLYDDIHNEAAELKLGGKLIFTGYIADELRPAIIAGAHAFCFPSLYEGFGMPPLEAMACGVPVLTSNVSSLPEVVGDTAVLVDPFSVADITQGLKEICFNDDLRKTMIEKGLKRAELFDWDKLAEQTYRIYQELLVR